MTYENFKIIIKTSDCTFAGTDTLLFLHLPFHANKSYTFKENLGPFQIYSDHGNLERNQTATQTVSFYILE